MLLCAAPQAWLLQVANEMTATSATQTKYNKAIDEMKLSNKELKMHLDLQDIMNAMPTTIHEDTPFQRTYRVFQTLGLRHLIVHDDEFQIVGMITRKDLFALQNQPLQTPSPRD